MYIHKQMNKQNLHKVRHLYYDTNIDKRRGGLLSVKLIKTKR